MKKFGGQRCPHGARTIFNKFNNCMRLNRPYINLMVTAEQTVLAAPWPPGIARQSSHFATAVSIGLWCDQLVSTIRLICGHLVVTWRSLCCLCGLRAANGVSLKSISSFTVIVRSSWSHDIVFSISHNYKAWTFSHKRIILVSTCTALVGLQHVKTRRV